MDALDQLAKTVHRLAAGEPRPTIAIDGPDAAGKTTLADKLRDLLRPEASVQLLRASIDDFHFPRAVRRQRGALSPEGYYLEAFDQVSLRDRLLVPFRSGQPKVVTALFDYDADRPAEVSVDVEPRAVLIVDGVFLQRPTLRELWSFLVYLSVDPDTSLRRGVARDSRSDAAADVERRYRERYLPGQALYRADVDPERRADVVLPGW